MTLSDGEIVESTLQRLYSPTRYPKVELAFNLAVQGNVVTAVAVAITRLMKIDLVVFQMEFEIRENK